MARLGHEMVRYADDSVILCRNEEEAKRALEGLEKDTYKITAKKKGYRKSKQRVELEEGEEGKVEIMMKKKKTKKSDENQIFHYDKPASIFSRSIERCLSLFHFSCNCLEEITKIFNVLLLYY